MATLGKSREVNTVITPIHTATGGLEISISGSYVQLQFENEGDAKAFHRALKNAQELKIVLRWSWASLEVEEINGR